MGDKLQASGRVVTMLDAVGSDDKDIIELLNLHNEVLMDMPIRPCTEDPNTPNLSLIHI